MLIPHSSEANSVHLFSCVQAAVPAVLSHHSPQPHRSLDSREPEQTAPGAPDDPLGGRTEDADLHSPAPETH